MQQSNLDKTDILLHLEKAVDEKMNAIKSDELLWLKLFFLFCGAVLSWEISFLAKLEIRSIILENHYIGYATSIFSSIATVLFAWLLLRYRWTYYELSQRFRKIQTLLELYDNEKWTKEAPLDDRYEFCTPMNFRNWRKQTKPFDTFVTRIVFLFGANFAVVSISLSILPWLNNYAILLIFLLCLLVFLPFYAILEIDYLHFKSVVKQNK